MPALDEPYARHRVLSTLVAEESEKALAAPGTVRDIQLGVVEPGDTLKAAKEKVESFFNELQLRVEELGFLDVFSGFESALAARPGRRGQPRIKSVKRLASYLQGVDLQLAEWLEKIWYERGRLAHGRISSQPLVVSIAEEKAILERILELLP